ncbi:tetratricopeptide repeat protein, partial [bacterium]
MSAGLSVSLFGPIRVILDGVPLPPVRSRKALSLLALLLLRNGRPAARGWLATTLWPDTDLTTALSSLRPVVSELRKALGPEGHRLKAGDRNSVAFEVDGMSVDALAFDEAIKVRAFASAVEKYTGPLLEGSEEEWAFQERRVRQEAFLSALMRLGETALEAGEPEKAISLFRRAVGTDPFRDSLRRGMIGAYAASGDLNAALQEYREYAHLLAGEFGTGPEEETTALYDRLRQEVRKPARAPHVRKGGAPPPVGHIPMPLTALIGRDDERIDVSGLLRRSRLVTLTGFGGIGKTRLALAVATDNAVQFPDGVWFVRLEELSDGDLLARQVGDVLGLREISKESPLKGLTDHLRDKTALLVLDNCEHIQDECAQLALRLLSECPTLKVLATGRQALGIVGETLWIVPPLAVPVPGGLPEGRATLQRVAMGYEGVRLFVERAEAAARDFTLTAANARTVAEICFRLEGIPLALELAAARVKTSTVEGIAERLRAQLDLSPSGRVVASRQGTLRSTLEWSHGLLSEPEQMFFRRSSVFLGGWTIDAAAALCADEMNRDQVSDLAASLVDQSLISLDAENGRYRWSEIVRQFAEEKLRAGGEAEIFRRRHLDGCVAFAEEAEPMLKGPEQQGWLRRFELEMPNLRAAADWAAANNSACEAGLRLASALSRFWYIRGEFKEGRARLETALGWLGAERRSSTRAKALYGLGILAYRQGDYDEAEAKHEESLSIRRELNDDRGIAESRLNLGNVAHSRG